MRMELFPTYINGRFSLLDKRDLVKERKNNSIWSLRLSTGIFGYTNCDVGNRGPKGRGEIMLAVGEEGLNKTIEFGFLPCPMCKPYLEHSFWDKISNTANKIYCVNSLEEFMDREKIPFDARRVSWEEILPVFEGTPSRLYVPKELDNPELIGLKEDLKK